MFFFILVFFKSFYLHIALFIYFTINIYFLPVQRITLCVAFIDANKYIFQTFIYAAQTHNVAWKYFRKKIHLI